MADGKGGPAATLLTLTALAAAGGLCWMAATTTARFIEAHSAQDVTLALQTGGFDWVDVVADGLQVTLSGTAPSEVERFRAVTEVAAVVDQNRIIDQMQVAQLQAIRPPDFGIELLRNDQGISLIGLVPASTDRLATVRELQTETAAPQVVDLLEAAEFPPPEGWDEALAYGLRVAQLAQRAKISVAPGRVAVSAITDSLSEKARLEKDLATDKPRSVALISEISAPREVIAPFTLRFVIDGSGPHFDACSASDDDDRKLILDAAARAGLAGDADCTLGLGSPSAEWGKAGAAAIDAVAGLGQGAVTISDADIALFAPASVDRAAFDDAAGKLEQALPSVFSLQAEQEQPQTASAGPAEFRASFSPDQTLYMRGRITDERMRDAVDSFARARFARVESTLRTDEAVPGGWTVRVIGALDAMAPLKNGSVTVSPDLVRITGTSGDRHASDKTAAILSQRLGPGAQYELAIRYDERLDQLLGLPTGAECVARLNTVMSESAIGFEPNKSIIAGDPQETLTLLSEADQDCNDFQIEIGGHTDSQGSDGSNADLSRARAQAILTAMSAAGIDTANMTARGYGESQPVASNETEEGREANRRIEFRLLSDLPVRRAPLPEPVLVAGTTRAAPAPEPEAEPEPAPAPEPDSPAENTATTGADSVAAAGDDETTPDAAPAPGSGPLPARDAALTRAATETAASVAGAAANATPRQPAGPVMPVPSIVGATEDLGAPRQPGLDAPRENANVPVLTPDDDTPRPSPRPEAATGGPDETEQQSQ